MTLIHLQSYCVDKKAQMNERTNGWTDFDIRVDIFYATSFVFKDLSVTLKYKKIKKLEIHLDQPIWEVKQQTAIAGA